ncbi:MAG TPA: LpqB family beta-propeller domain-containing protein [Thermoanaerobaculia bacterium]|nr:LpqB family beta-propeller domain-containing protein [Thermoanaerobaculia bacterium]
MSLSSGTKLGPYEILGQIGAGGMGEVYRARDPRLGREVAIKVLPASFSSDADRLRRFEQEAKAAGVLNHPNITAVYDIGASEGAPYVVQELLEGETLRSVLAGGRLSPRKCSDYALQVAHGLGAAHEKGIVHRDLKPENLFVTRDGRVKILDFGLAKLTHQEEGSQVTNLPTATAGTEPGVVLGTIGYMSPEQVRGKPADARSDIFSFGAILYETLSGKRAFHGDSVADTMSAILKDDPPDLSVTNQNVSPGLERIVRHCLEKNPEQRFHSAHDLAFALEALSGTSAPALALPGPARAPAVRWPAAIAAAAAALAVGFGIGRWTQGPPPPPPEIVPLTYSGRDIQPAASPDGKTVAFTSGRERGKARIWVKQIRDGSEAPLTAGPGDTHPRFSPDGTAILFSRAPSDVDVSIYRVATVGGEPRKLLSNAYEADWSPDGTRLAFLRGGRTSEEVEVGIAAADGGDERILSRFKDTPLRRPRWTPDGRAILAVQTTGNMTRTGRFHLIPLDGSERSVLSAPEARGQLSSVAWSGSQMIYMQGAAPTSNVRSVTARVLEQRPGATEARVLLNLPSFGETLDILAEGRLVFDASTSSAMLREVAAPGASSARPQGWVSRGHSTDRQPVYSPDGKRIVFASDRGGDFDIWEANLETGALRRLTDQPGEDWDPALSPDGKHLLWSSNRSGPFEVWMADADGSGARQVTHDGTDAENPTMTRDGQWIVYASAGEKRQGLWKIHPDGSGDARLVSGSIVHPEVSPDGTLAVYHTPTATRVVRISDGVVLPFSIDLQALGANVGRARWTPDGKRLALLGRAPEGYGVFVQDFSPDAADTSTTRRQLAGFDAERFTDSFGIAPDGSRLVLAEGEIRDVLYVASGVPGVVKGRRNK